MNKTNLHIEVGNLLSRHKDRVVEDCTLSSKDGSRHRELEVPRHKRVLKKSYMKIKFDKRQKAVEKS